jgi:hypothetical protein
MVLPAVLLDRRPRRNCDVVGFSRPIKALNYVARVWLCVQTTSLSDRLLLIVDFGRGLLPSLVQARDKLTNERPECLRDPALAGVRRFLQTHFPDLPSDKVPVERSACLRRTTLSLRRVASRRVASRLVVDRIMRCTSH